MEWYGINLNYHRPKKWLLKSLKRLAITISTLLLGISLAFGIWQKNLQQKTQNQRLQAELQQIEKNIANTSQQIAMLKAQGNGKNTSITLKQEEIQDFIKLLSELPINGGLDYAQIEHSNGIKINIAGKLSPSDFSKLEQHLKQKQYTYQIEHLQTNEQHFLEFNLTLSFQK